MGLSIYSVDYIFQHAFSTLTLFGPKYSRIRQVLAARYNLSSSAQSIQWAVSSPDSSRIQRFNLKLHYATIYW